MKDLKDLFKNRKIDYQKLIKYGFKKDNNTYNYEKIICNSEFKVIIMINEQKKIAKLIDLNFNEEYVMANLETGGVFVSKVKEEYDNLLKDIINNCTSMEAFSHNQTQEAIAYIKDKYHDNLEYLWDKYPNCAITRCQENRKWYALFVTIPLNKIGINSDEEVEILDLRYQKDKIEKFIDNKKIFQGYHMNKKSWITIKLDNSLRMNEIKELIDNSYYLARNQK